MVKGEEPPQKVGGRGKGNNMSEWFTVEQIKRDTYAISEYRHWEESHCYLLLGARRALLIDSGLGVADIGRVVRELTPLPVLLATTHAHWDHIGGHHRFAFEDIAVGAQEREWLAGHFPLPLSAVKAELLRGETAFPTAFVLEQYRLYQGGAAIVLNDGDAIDLGEREVEVLHTPGHSPGHLCFYEPQRGTLYAGDLVYAGCLDAFYPTTDPLAFWRSIQRVHALSPRRVLPGHHRLDIPAELVGEIDRAFAGLWARGECRQGLGVRDFGAFQLHL